MYCSLNFSCSLDVILDSLDKLSLVLPEGPSDVGPDEHGVEPGVDTEHFIGILSRAEPGSDPGLHHVNLSSYLFVEASQASLPSLVMSTYFTFSRARLTNSISISSLQSNGLWLDLLPLDLQMVGLADLLGQGGPQHSHYH